MDGTGRQPPMPGHGLESSGRKAGPLTAEEFAALFQREARVLWTIAAAVLGDASEADDVLQEAALMALGKLDRFERDTHFTAWMGRFVRNVAINSVRKRARRDTRPVAPESLGHLGAPEIPGRPPVDTNGRVLADQAEFDDQLLAPYRPEKPGDRR